jgi:hypothetical protein
MDPMSQHGNARGTYHAQAVCASRPWQSCMLVHAARSNATDSKTEPASSAVGGRPMCVQKMTIRRRSGPRGELFKDLQDGKALLSSVPSPHVCD